MDLFNYQPRHSHEVRIGNKPLGGLQPLRLQSMTTTLTTTRRQVWRSVSTLLRPVPTTFGSLRRDCARPKISKTSAKPCTDRALTRLSWPMYTLIPEWRTQRPRVEKCASIPGNYVVRLARSRNWSTPTRVCRRTGALGRALCAISRHLSCPRHSSAHRCKSR